jgi:predicted lipoprotein with Yx(FWY)xxD motif
VNRKTYGLALLAVLSVAAVVVAGCGGGDSTGSSYGGGKSSSGNQSSNNKNAASESGGRNGNSNSSDSKATGAEAGAVVVSLGNVQKLGMVLVDSNGMTLYDFHKDKGGKSSCYGACTAVWPPLLTEGKPQVGNGASASMIGTVERKDGTMQVTYAGHPLYTYLGDKKPGEATGNDIDDFGAEWYALQGNGEEPED